ncbi:drosulfakinin isoform X1 [Temnothorax americanus]|uniref:drosulfakinin isoform X1 n=2 Tax=Temnothorax americanus TaxID=1964332 RepID=UPI0040694B7C
MITDMNLTLALSCMIAIMLFCGRCKAAPGLITGVHRNLGKHPHIRGYAVEGLMKDLVEDLVGEDEDNLRLSKRQQLDDYGHLRFGKRSNGDDEEYGHSYLRFGRNIE